MRLIINLVWPNNTYWSFDVWLCFVSFKKYFGVYSMFKEYQYSKICPFFPPLWLLAWPKEKKRNSILFWICHLLVIKLCYQVTFFLVTFRNSLIFGHYIFWEWQWKFEKTNFQRRERAETACCKVKELFIFCGVFLLHICIIFLWLKFC